MKKRIPFILQTEDPEFIPDANDLKTANKWIYGDGPAIAGTGIVIVVGAGMILLAFIDPEPTSRLGMMVGGGTLLVLTGGLFIFTIAVMRRKYSFKFRAGKDGKIEWLATPPDE